MVGGEGVAIPCVSFVGGGGGGGRRLLLSPLAEAGDEAVERVLVFCGGGGGADARGGENAAVGGFAELECAGSGVVGGGGFASVGEGSEAEAAAEGCVAENGAHDAQKQGGEEEVDLDDAGLEEEEEAGHDRQEFRGFLHG